MIDAGPPTAEMLEWAARLGINTASMNTGELRSNLDKATATAGRRALRENQALVVNGYIVHDGAVYEITAIHQNKRLTVSIRPVAGGRTRVVAAYTLAEAKRADTASVRSAMYAGACG
jgi:hypothetical protein